MKTPTYSKPDRVAAAHTIQTTIEELYGVTLAIDTTHLGENWVQIGEPDEKPIPTKYGPMKFCVSLEPDFAHCARRFESKPDGPLPSGPSFNPHSFKWNWWSSPPTTSNTKGHLDAWVRALQHQMEAIAP